MDEHGDRSIDRDGVTQPAVVVRVAEQIGVGADEPPPGGVERKAVAAPRVDERGKPARPMLLLAVEADVVIAGNRHPRTGQIGEYGAGEGAILVVVGILVDDVTGEGDEVGRVVGDLTEQPAQRCREAGWRPTGGCR